MVIKNQNLKKFVAKGKMIVSILFVESFWHLVYIEYRSLNFIYYENIRLTGIESGLFQNPPFTKSGVAITPHNPPPKWTAVVSSGSSTKQNIIIQLKRKLWKKIKA